MVDMTVMLDQLEEQLTGNVLLDPFTHKYMIKGQTDLTTSYSGWSAFRNCRKRFELRYMCGLVPLEQNMNLAFGTVIHSALETWFKTNSKDAVSKLLDATYEMRHFDQYMKRNWHYAVAMLNRYISQYPEEIFQVLAIEDIFKVPIVNPRTKAQSQTFNISGKIDLLVRHNNGEIWIYDHKTASSITSDYIERLWCDMQLLIYARYYARYTGLQIAGCCYDILTKPKLQQSIGESEEEFAVRYAELCAKNKNGKSTATRKMPETDEAFQGRLAERLSEPGTFHREYIPLDQNRLDAIESEIWELTQQLLAARRSGIFYQNTDHCFDFRKPCPYFPICRSNFNELVAQNHYEVKEPHTELTESDEVAEESVPF